MSTKALHVHIIGDNKLKRFMQGRVPVSQWLNMFKSRDAERDCYDEVTHRVTDVFHTVVACHALHHFVGPCARQTSQAAIKASTAKAYKFNAYKVDLLGPSIFKVMTN